MLKKGFRLGMAVLGLAAAWPAAAQDLNEGEVVVTGTRARPVYLDPRTNTAIEVEEDASALPAIGLRRRADFALLPVEAHGLDRPVEWRRAGATEVFLYIPHRIVFRPAG